MYLEIPKRPIIWNGGSKDDKHRNPLPSGFAALSSLFLSVVLGGEIVNFLTLY